MFLSSLCHWKGDDIINWTTHEVMRCMIEYLHWNLEGAPLSKKCYRVIVLQPYACDATRTTNHSDSLASPSPPVELFYPFVQWSIQAGGRARAGGGRGRNEDEWLELPRERKGATCFPAGPTAAVSEKKKRKEGGRMRISSCLREKLKRTPSAASW